MLIIKSFDHNQSIEIKQLMSLHFLITSNVLIEDSSEIINETLTNMLMDSNSSIYLQNHDNKIKLLYPFLIITSSYNIIKDLHDKFICDDISVDTIESLISNSIVFIKNGFLPLSDTIIHNYLLNTSFSSPTDSKIYIFNIFETLGYISRINNFSYKPTCKLINALADTKYAINIIILENNATSDNIYSESKYIDSLYEILKLIDINIFESVDRFIQKQKNET